MAHSSPCEPSGTGTSQAEPGSGSTRPGESPVQVISTLEKVASGIPSTRLTKDQSAQALSRSPETVNSNIRRVDSRLNPPPSGSDGYKQEEELSDLSVQPPNSNPDQSGPQTSNQLNLKGKLFYETFRSADMLNPNKAVKSISPVSASVAQFHVMTSKPSRSGSDLRAYEANSSTPRNLSSVLMSVAKDNTTLQETKFLEETLNITMSENSLQCVPECMLKREKEKNGMSALTDSVQVSGLRAEPAQNPTRRVIKEQPEAVESAALLNRDCCPLKSEVCLLNWLAFFLV